MIDREADANRLAAQALAEGDPTGWFEPLYAEAARGDAIVPWDRGVPNPVLVEWVEREAVRGNGRRAVVVGCGLGRDAEFLASLGFATTAFDISPTAVDGARHRHPGSSVHYEAADLLALPDRYRAAFDLVLESYTVQSLPSSVRPAAIKQVPRMLAAGATLAVLAAAHTDDAHTDDGPPWPLTRAEIDHFAGETVLTVRIEELVDDAGVHRWRAQFRAPD